MDMFDVLDKCYAALPEEKQNELLEGYTEAFPDWNKEQVYDAMLDNAADSGEVLSDHLVWILSRLPQSEFAEERRAVEKWLREVTINTSEEEFAETISKLKGV